MRVLYALFCEDARARDDGRMDVHGAFHQLFAPGFPARQDEIMLVAELEWESGEEGRIPFRFDFLDPTGTLVFSIPGHTEVGPRQEMQAPPRTRLLMSLDEGVGFRIPGTYELELEVAGVRHSLLPLHLIEHPDAR